MPSGEKAMPPMESIRRCGPRASGPSDPSPHVPELDRPIRAGRGEDLAVGGERELVQIGPGVPAEAADELAGGQRPRGSPLDPCRPRPEPGAVRVEGDRIDRRAGGQWCG